MATQSEMIKARQLMKDNWLTLTDAVAQARTPTTPTTPQVPPATPPTQTPQKMQGVNWETFQVAPVNPQTGLSQPQTAEVPTTTPTAPVTPTQPVAPVTAEVPKTETQIASTTPDKNAEIKAKNEAQMALNKQNAQLREDARQKDITEQNNQLANNEGAILNTLKTGGIIPDVVKTSPYYKNALDTYNKIQQYSSLSLWQLTTALDNWLIMPWTSLYNEMMKDPAMKNKLTEAQIYTTGKASIPQYDTVTQEIISSNPTTASFLADGVITQDEWDTATNNAEVVAKARDVEAKTNKYNEKYAEWEAIEDEVKAQFPWSPFADSIIADRQKAKWKDVILAKWEMDTANGTLTELKTKAGNLFETNLKLYEDQKKTQDTYNLEAYRAKLWLATNQAEFDQKIAQQAQAMNDPTTAISTMVEEYKKLGIPFTRSTQQIIQDFQTSGLDLPTYLSQLQGTIQSKPEYKALQEYNMSKFAPKATENFELKEVGGKTYKFNQATGQYEIISPITAWSGGDLRYLADQFPWQAWAKNNNPAGITWNANFDKWTGTAKLLADAGIQFAKWTPRPANEGGNYVTFATIEDGLKAQQIIMSQTYGNSTVGQMLASWVGTWEGANYAKQVAGMAWVDPNVKVSSLTPEQLSTLQMAKIKKESPGLYGILSQGTGTTGTQYNDQNIADLAYLVELQEKNPTQASKDMKELWYTARDIANYKAGNVPLTDKQKQTSVSVIDDIKDLVTNYDWNDATWFHAWMPVIAGTDRADTIQKIEQLVAKMTLPNLGSLKWPMSDKDLAFITKASSNLSAELSDDQFEKNLIQAYNVAARRAGIPEITKLSDIGKTTQQTQTNTGVGQISTQAQSIRNEWESRNN